jgi:protein SCO1
MMGVKPQMIVIGFAAALAAVAMFAWLNPPATVTLRAATLLSEPRPMPSFELIDQHGAAVTRTAFEGRWSVVFAGFTHCPDVCPATLSELGALERRLGARAERLQTVLLSVDPARDTPARLAAYLKVFPAPMLGLTGPEAEIERLATGLGLSFIQMPRAHGDYTVDHSAALVLIDPAARVAGYAVPPFDFDELQSDLTLLLDR